MDNKKVDFIVYEANEARHERTVKRLIIALIISIILMFASHALWLWAWTSYDYSSKETTYSQDGEGINNINTGKQGDLNNGAKTDDKKKNKAIEKSE